ncbi:MAG: MarR family transcriptional regulator [Candidatus Bathyarchaeota archaeon]|nr:MarR family transcriptional regulator [Candidatus Bathyarchaeota archaeon]MCX8176768.1 MarR family transcriptional regulator [Candidatus Bathyarchaeota archaeon]MDW8193297.1 MarR family transcriptional regulator [Nitrososphaerota archaeon]
MIDLFVFLAGIFVTVVIISALGYYRFLLKIKREYENAKETFKDIILSFKKEIRNVTNALDDIHSRVHIASSKSEDAIKRFESIEEKIKMMETRVSIDPEYLKVLQEKICDVEKRIHNVEASQTVIMDKISLLENKIQQLPEASPEVNVDAVIPIKREKALAPLTETELAVLEILTKEGPKTAPEIKDKIKLSREHTARLMKKLYESGYLERDSSKVPFRYSIKKEMEHLLQRSEES